MHPGRVLLRVMWMRQQQPPSQLLAGQAAPNAAQQTEATLPQWLDLFLPPCACREQVAPDAAPPWCKLIRPPFCLIPLPLTAAGRRWCRMRRPPWCGSWRCPSTCTSRWAALRCAVHAVHAVHAWAGFAANAVHVLVGALWGV